MPGWQILALAQPTCYSPTRDEANPAPAAVFSSIRPLIFAAVEVEERSSDGPSS